MAQNDILKNNVTTYSTLAELELDENMEFYYDTAPAAEKQAFADYHDIIKNAYDAVYQVWDIE